MRSYSDLIYKYLSSEMQSWILAAHDQLRAVRESRAFRNRVANAPACSLSEKNILFVVIDCLRADKTISGGHSRETTPFLSKTFQQISPCISTAPWTLPSVPSILSGLYPHNHGAVFTDSFRNWHQTNSPSLMAEDVFTLPEMLSSSGYEIFCNTAVVTSLAPLHGRFPDANRNMHAKAKTMVDDCIDWWKSTAGPKFGYLHLGDLHGLGSNPRVYPTDGKYPFGVYNESTILSGEPDKKSYGTTYERVYDTNLRYVDSHLERLYESIIRSSGETVLVVVGDHGQAMREHTVEKQEWFEYPYEMSGYGHGFDLFQESINVPLYISDIDDINTSQPIVSTIDIVPTVLDILDAQIDIPMDGESLSKTLQDDRKIISQEVSVGFEQIAVVTEDRKLYFSPKNNILKMIRLGENTEAVIQSPTVDDNELQQSLFEMIPDQKISGQRINLDKKTQSQLKELGYI